MSTTAPLESAQLLRGKYESWALRLLREGATPRHVVEQTGLTMERLRELVAEQPLTAAPPCPNRHCGQPQHGPGHPRRGWVQLKVAGETPARWFCQWSCVARHAIARRRA